ncbi:MAG TPA: hypothetical protein VHX87_09885 [Galbitalea sp.]|nr:hypothetical protein [Galbitalea sp.]
MSERPKNPLLYTLAALVLLEGAGLVAGTIYLVVEIFVGNPEYPATAIAYAVTAAIFAVLVIMVGWNILRARPWIRGAVVALAVLQGLVAYSILVTKEPTLGWVLLAPALVLVVLVFTRPVLRATARPSRDDDDRDHRTF